MNAQIATLAYIGAILGLFFLDRDRSVRTSKALWIPVTWLLINGSRPVSEWLQTGPTVAPVDQYVEGSPLDALVFGVLIMAGLIVLAYRGRQVGMFLLANLPILLFLSYCAISILWSDYPFVAFKRWAKAAGDVLMVLIVLTDAYPISAIKRFLSRAAFILIPFSVLFIKYYPNLGRSYNYWTWVPMYSGVTTYKNLLGMTCMICGLGSLWCFMAAYRDREDTRRTRHLIAHGVILAMVIWLFWIADSMTSLSCFVMAGSVMAMTGRPWVARRAWAVHVLVTVVIVLSLSVLFFDSGRSLVQLLGRDTTLTGRTAIWAAVLAVSGNPLLGSGFESFWTGDRIQRVLDLSGQQVQEAHNGYVEVYLNLGWIGLSLLAVLIVTGYRNVITVFRQDSHAGRIRLGCFVVGIIYSFTEAGFRMMSPVWIAFLLAITAVANAPVPEGPTSLRNNDTLSKAEPQVADMVGVGVHQKRV